MHSTCADLDCAMPAAAEIDIPDGWPQRPITHPYCGSHLLVAVKREIRRVPFFTIRSLVAS